MAKRKRRKSNNNNAISNTWFWIKHLSLGFLLVWAAYYFLFGAAKHMNFKETTNVAARGLSQFYESFRNRVSDRDTEREKFVITIGKPTYPLEDAIARRELAVKPSNPRWTGAILPRRFEAGDTLKEVLTEQAKAEGVELYWYLERDYVVKYNFRLDTDFVSALYQVGTAIDDDFEFEVFTFFCHKARAAVITENPSIYVRENCKKLENLR
ncbi:TcpQ domain-containing protein [Pseudoalteromonas sp. T1lg65]|uniref:TcpQ domain-containing protein n=1 Tax=Pseudoalteromonas sp. T1lg65 TaxID=2077101 RepID=UPI003F798E78